LSGSPPASSFFSPPSCSLATTDESGGPASSGSTKRCESERLSFPNTRLQLDAIASASARLATDQMNAHRRGVFAIIA
jgi:hypothetical protein